MIGQMSPRERFGLALVVLLGFLGVSYVGAQKMREPAPLVLQPVESPKTKPVATPGAPERTELFVHVTGAVRQPGVLRLPVTARVHDAVRLAGGSTEEADLDSVNLAATLEDGTQLYVPRKQLPAEPEQVIPQYRGGERAPRRYASRSDLTPKVEAKSTKSSDLQVVNLNTASVEALETLPGVGPATAARIIEFRKSHGGFGSVDELLTVKGIGPKKLEQMRKWIKL